MDLEVTNLVNNEIRDYTQFFNRMKSNLIVKFDESEIVENTEWIEEVLFTIPYIEKAFENAKKQLVTEEEILKMELIKKVSVESIKHLSKHTNFVTKFDEETGEVIPEKLLNTTKEETIDTYENRFLYSLVLLINDFITVRERATKNKTQYKGKKKKEASYEASTTYKREKVNLRFEYSSERAEAEEKNDSVENDVQEIQKRLKDIRAMDLFKQLEAKRVILVKSPLKMTNVLLKNVNYQYGVKLWNYLQNNFDIKNKAVQKKHENENQKFLKKLVDQDFLIKYIIFKNTDHENSKKIQQNTILSQSEADEITDKLVEQIVKLNPKLAEKELKEMVLKKYLKIKKIKEISLKPIENRFKLNIEKYMKEIESNTLK